MTFVCKSCRGLLSLISLHNVMRYPAYFFRASLNTLILSICVCCLIFSSVHSSSAVTRFCNKIVPFPSLQVMQALWVSDVNDYILGSNFNIKGIIEKNKGFYWGAEFESWISSAPCYTLEKKHATINWTIHRLGTIIINLFYTFWILRQTLAILGQDFPSVDAHW